MKTNRFNPGEILASFQFEKVNKHANILIAASFWEKDRYEAAQICYQFMRKIDDMIDDRKALIDSLDDCEKELFTDQVNDWIECLQGKTINEPLLGEVIRIISTYNIPLNLFQSFAKSMIYDIHHDGFPDFDSFLQYAEGASVAPASVFLHLCCLNDEHTKYVMPTLDLLSLARPCAIFSYIVHILRDFQIDQQNNLNYFALDILKDNNLFPEDLKKMAQKGNISQDFRNVIKTYCKYAEVYKQETEKAIKELAPFLHPRYLLSLRIIFSLYLEVYNRIDTEHGLFSPEELTPTHEETRLIVSKLIDDH